MQSFMQTAETDQTLRMQRLIGAFPVPKVFGRFYCTMAQCEK